MAKTDQGLESLLTMPSGTPRYFSDEFQQRLKVPGSSLDGRIAYGLVQHVPTVADCVPELSWERAWWDGFVEEERAGEIQNVEIGGRILKIQGSVPLNGYGEGFGKENAFRKPLEVISLEPVGARLSDDKGFYVVHWVYDPASRKRFLVGRHGSSKGSRYIRKGDAKRKQSHLLIQSERRGASRYFVLDQEKESDLMKLASFRS